MERRREQEDRREKKPKIKDLSIQFGEVALLSFLLTVNDTVHFFHLRKKKTSKFPQRMDGWTKRAGMTKPKCDHVKDG